MKAKFYIPLFALLPLWFVTSAQAALVASDDFNSYSSDVDLSGGNGGTGWTNAWTGNSGEVTSQAGVIPDAGVSMQITVEAEEDPAAKRSFTSQTGTVYLGFQMKTSGLADSEFFQIYLNDGSGINTVGGSTGLRNSTGNPAFVRVAESSNSTNLTGSVVDDEFVHQFVLKLSKTGTGHPSNYDFAEVFIDLATEDTGAPLTNYASQVANSTISSLDTVAFRTYQFDLNNDYIYIDNIRVATTYAEALAIPEPSSLLLIGLSLGSLLILRRRN